MNTLNETLAIIRRQKTIYQRELDKTENIEKQKQLKVMLDELSAEEEKILNQFGVPVCK